LGALLWSLDFGERKHLRHSLGAGKPYGYGQVAVTLVDSSLRLNKTMDMDDDTLLVVARAAFDELMQQAWRAAVDDGVADWQKSPQLQQLLAMADPQEATQQQFDYPALADFREFKQVKPGKPGKRLAPYVNAGAVAEPNGRRPLARAPVQSRNMDELKEAIEQSIIDEKVRIDKVEALQRMSPEERMVAQIDELVKKFGENSSSTNQSKLVKSLRDALGEAESLSPGAAAKLVEVVAVADELARSLNKTSNKLGKATKKLLKKIR
jgi:hypothetical protein